MFFNSVFAEVVDNTFSINDDLFATTFTIGGITERDKKSLADGERTWSIHSSIDKISHDATHQLDLTLVYKGESDWFNNATDDDGKPLVITEISSNIISCSTDCWLKVRIAINIDDTTLKNKIRSGYNIKIYAPNGQSYIIKISSLQIDRQLLVINSHLKNKTIFDIGQNEADHAAPSDPTKAHLGIIAFDLTRAATLFMNRGDFKAASITNISKGSVAEKAGLKLADLIYEYDGKSIQGQLDLKNAEAVTKLGSKVAIKVLRGKKHEEITIDAQF